MSELHQAQARLEARRATVKTAADAKQLIGQLVAQLPPPVLIDAPSGVFRPELWAAWCSAPLAVSETEHEWFCEDGFLEVAGEQSRVCPVCEAKKRLAHLSAQLTESGVEARYLNVTWDDLDLSQKPFARMKKAAARIEQMFEKRVSMIFHGHYGGGKTQVAMLFARAAIAANRSVRVVSLGELAADVRDGFNSDGAKLSTGQAVARMVGCDLLVLEDVGAGESSAKNHEVTLAFRALNKRYNMGKPTIITSNLDLSEIVELLGPRVMGRLQPMVNIPFEHGVNYREPRDLDELLWF